MNKSSIFATVGCFTLFTLSCFAQLLDPVNLPGHQIGDSEILTKNPIVVVATLKSNGRKDLGSVGRDIYNYVSISTEEALTGEAPREIVGTYTCNTAPAAIAEHVPTIGEKYIVFLEKGHLNFPGKAYTLIKFLAYSDKEVNRLKKMLTKAE